jgi:hypothetical protein
MRQRHTMGHDRVAIMISDPPRRRPEGRLLRTRLTNGILQHVSAHLRGILILGLAFGSIDPNVRSKLLSLALAPALAWVLAHFWKDGACVSRSKHAAKTL